MVPRGPMASQRCCLWLLTTDMMREDNTFLSSLLPWSRRLRWAKISRPFEYHLLRSSWDTFSGIFWGPLQLQSLGSSEVHWSMDLTRSLTMHTMLNSFFRPQSLIHGLVQSIIPKLFLPFHVFSPSYFLCKPFLSSFCLFRWLLLSCFWNKASTPETSLMLYSVYSGVLKQCSF